MYLRALPGVRGDISAGGSGDRSGNPAQARDTHGAPATDVTALRGTAIDGVDGVDGGAKDVNGVNDGNRDAHRDTHRDAHRDAHRDGNRDVSRDVSGARLFIANCASCHRWTGVGVGASAPGAYPSLMHNSVVGAADTTNLVMVILHGVSRKTQNADILMPSFADQLTDDQIAELGDYVTKQFGNPHSSTTAKQVARLRSQSQ